MGWLRVTDASSLDALNATQTDRKITPVAGMRGGLLVCDDLLTDCGNGQTWEAYHDFLLSLSPTDEQPQPAERETPS